MLVYNALIQPHFDYCYEAWDELGKGLSERLQKLQNRAARLIMNFKNEHGQSILARTALGWTSLEERRSLMKAKLMYKTVDQLAPQRLCNIFQFLNNVTSYNLRGSSNGLFIPRPRTEFLKSFIVGLLEYIVGNYGIKYQKISEIRHLITCFAKIFLPRPPNY